MVKSKYSNAIMALSFFYPYSSLYICALTLSISLSCLSLLLSPFLSPSYSLCPLKASFVSQVHTIRNMVIDTFPNFHLTVSATGQRHYATLGPLKSRCQDGVTSPEMYCG